MPRQEVKAANERLRDAKLDAKVAEIDAEAREIAGIEKSEDDGLVSALQIREDKGMVTIVLGGVSYQVAGFADYRETKATMKQMAEAAKAIGARGKVWRKKLQALIERQHDGYDFTRRMGEAQDGTHHALTDYRDDADGFLMLMNGILPFVNAYIQGVNRLDVANPTVVGMAQALQVYASKSKTPQMEAFGNMLVALLNAIAFYDPVEGIASIFTAKGFSLTGTPTTALPATSGGFLIT